MKLKNLFLLLIIATITFSCRQVDKNEVKASNLPQGEIKYKITFPDVKAEGIMASMLPDTMVAVFKGHKFRSDVKSMVKTAFISDESNRSMKTILVNMGTKSVCDLNEEEVEEFLAEFPDLDIIHTKETEKILGFNCKKSIAVFHDASKEIELWHTDDLGIDHMNWYNPYEEINGLLLRYEIKYYGVNMKFDAVKYEKKNISDKVFELPKDKKFRKIHNKEMKQKLTEFMSIVNEM